MPAYDAAVASSDVVRALGLREALVRGHVGDRQAMMTLQTDAGLTSARLSAAFASSSACCCSRWRSASARCWRSMRRSAPARCSPRCSSSAARWRRSTSWSAAGGPSSRRAARSPCSTNCSPRRRPMSRRTRLPEPGGQAGSAGPGGRRPGPEADPLQRQLRGRAGRSGGDRRAERGGQVDAGPGDCRRAAAQRRLRPLRRRRAARLGPRAARPPCRLHAAGNHAVRRHHQGEYLALPRPARRGSGDHRR